MQRHGGVGEPGERRLGVGVRREHDALRADRPARGHEAPVGDTEDRAVRDDPHTGRERRRRETAGVGERIEMAAVGVGQRAVPPVRADPARRLRPVEHLDPVAVARPVRGAFLEPRQSVRRMGRHEPAALHRVAGDGLVADDPEDARGRAADGGDQPFARRAQLGDDVGGAEPREGGNHQTAVAPGSAVADRGALDHQNVDARAGERAGEREAEDAGADHHDVGADRTLDGRQRRRLRRRRVPERGGERVRDHRPAFTRANRPFIVSMSRVRTSANWPFWMRQIRAGPVTSPFWSNWNGPVAPT